MYKLIKTEADYDRALERIDKLMGARPGTPKSDEMELLVTLVGLYEEKRHPVPPPSPVEAIEFMMDQLDLKQKDLIPFIGAKSKVSEVLSGRRPLTLSMIRALHRYLGIPADTLLREKHAELPKQPSGIDWLRYPLKELADRRWISRLPDLKSHAEELVRGLAARAGDSDMILLPEACFRKSTRKNAKSDPYALHAWILGVMAQAAENPLPKFDPSRLNKDFLKKVARLSLFEKGPLMAQEYLAAHGIALIVAKHFRRTYLDGAAMLLKNHAPVVGLTLRYDRIDNFWFNLLHELVHVMKHLSRDKTTFIVDDFDLKSLEAHELEADEMAMEAEIPKEIWEKHPARQSGKIQDIQDLAGNLEIHHAIVAGRVRYEKGDFRILSKHVGHKKVRRLFPEWGAE